MNTYRVDMPNNTYKIIEAEYFDVVYDSDGTSANFYVDRIEDITGGTMTVRVLVGYARNPDFVRFDDTYVVKPKQTRTLQEYKDDLARERHERSTFYMPCETSLDRNYDGL